MTNRCYSELSKLKTFEERLEYLKLDGTVGDETFGYDRYLNQQFYRSAEWRRIRNQVIIRDMGCDLGIEGYDIHGRILIHHMNPVNEKDILCHSQNLVDPEFLIAVSHQTHNAIHYGNTEAIMVPPIERTANDTCPWKMKR